MCLWRPKGTESTLALHVSSPTFERHFSISLAFKSNQSHSIPSSLNDVAILTREHFLLWPCGVLNETHEHQNAQQSESLRKSTTSDKPDDLSSPLVNTWHYCATCEQEPWPSSCEGAMEINLRIPSERALPLTNPMTSPLHLWTPDIIVPHVNRNHDQAPASLPDTGGPCGLPGWMPWCCIHVAVALRVPELSCQRYPSKTEWQTIVESHTRKTWHCFGFFFTAFLTTGCQCILTL